MVYWKVCLVFYSRRFICIGYRHIGYDYMYGINVGRLNIEQSYHIHLWRIFLRHEIVIFRSCKRQHDKMS